MRRSRLPTEESARLALRTQQIIANETGVTNVADPVGGSVYIEELTDQIERGARDYIDRIDAMGGTLAAIEKRVHPGRDSKRGLRVPEIGGARRNHRGGREPVPPGGGESAGDVPHGPGAGAYRRSSGCASSARRVRVEVEIASSALEQAARGSDNLMPRILAACEAYATVGEISDRLRRVFGEYRDHS